MSLEETNLKVGGLEFRGVYIALIITIVSTISGGIWTASTLYGRLEGVESRSIPDVEPLSKRLSIVEQQIDDNDVSELQGKLAVLGTNLNTIVEQQQKLLLIQEKVTALDKSIVSMEATVKKAEIITAENDKLVTQMESIKREINDLWAALDYLSDPFSS